MIKKKSQTSNFGRITLTIPEEILKKFKNYCEANAFNISAKITKLIEKELEGK
ncbi:MAG: CopG family transcriptional regulator [bacterium]